MTDNTPSSPSRPPATPHDDQQESSSTTTPTYAESTTSTISAGTNTNLTGTINALNVQHAVSDLKKSDWWVGNPNLIKNVKWLVREKTFSLVRADDESEAEVEFIGTVDRQESNFNLYIDGGWKPTYNSPFANIKARAHIIKPGYNLWQPAAAIWDDQIKGFQALQKTKATKDATPLNMIVNANNAIVIRHIIFETKGLNNYLYNMGNDNQTNDDDDDDDILDESSPFHMKQWKCTTEQGQEKLKEIIDEGVLKGNILPAFHAGPGDNLIEPNDYRQCLSGALVLVKVAVTFQNLGGTGKSRNEDSFYAEIREIRVISPPPPPPQSPSKRRLRNALANSTKKVRQQ